MRLPQQRAKTVLDSKFATPTEWNDLRTSRKRDLIYVRDDIDKFKRKAEKILKQMTDAGTFSWKNFKIKLKLDTNSYTRDTHLSLKELYNQKIKKCRYKTKRWYTVSLNAILEFAGKDDLALNKLTTEFLNQFQEYKSQHGASPTKVNSYLKALRAIVNEQIELGNYSENLSPFGKRKYRISKNHSRQSGVIFY